MQVYLTRIPDNNLVICLSRGVDQLQGDASKVDCQPVRKHLLNSLSGDLPKGRGDLCGVDIGGCGGSVKAQV